MRLNRALTSRLAGVLLGATWLAPLPAQSPTPPISQDEIRAHIRFLSSDLLEGRAPATRGGRVTEEYIATQLMAYGVEPGNNGSYFQRVPIDVVGSDPATMRVNASGKATASLSYPNDVVVWAGSSVERSGTRAPVVFVG